MDINNLLSRTLGNQFTGLGRAVLGEPNGRFNMNFDWTPLNVRTVWIDTSYNELMSIAMNTPHLNVVISRMAELFSQMVIKHVDKDGKDVPNSEILKFMRKPSLLRTQEQWLYEYYIYNAIYSNVFIYMLKGIPSAFPSGLPILQSGLVKGNFTGKRVRQTSIEGIIESWSMLGEPIDFKPSEILHITEGMSMNAIVGMSKIVSLQIPLSNIMAALKSNNIILTERGMIGFLVTDPKDSAGSLPLSGTMKKAVQDTYAKKNSLDSRENHVGLFTSETKWVPMTFDVGQLKLLEGLEDSFGLICGMYGADRDIFPSVKGATNENKTAGLRATIQMTLNPLGNKMLNKIAIDVFGMDIDDEKLIGDFSHMPIMQEDKVKEGQAYLFTVQAAETLFQNNIISAEDFAEQCEVDMTGTGEVPQPPAPILAAPPTPGATSPIPPPTKTGKVPTPKQPKK